MKTKYVQIDRGASYYNTVTTLAVAKDMVSRGIASGYKKVTLKEIKQSNLHIYRECDYIRHKQVEEMQEKYHNKELTGRFLWIDEHYGDSMIRLEDGQTLYCHFSAIEGLKVKQYSYPDEVDKDFLRSLKGKSVKCVGYIDPGYFGVSKAKLHE